MRLRPLRPYGVAFPKEPNFRLISKHGQSNIFFGVVCKYDAVKPSTTVL
jgi:hypothetical protein